MDETTKKKKSLNYRKWQDILDQSQKFQENTVSQYLVIQKHLKKNLTLQVSTVGKEEKKSEYAIQLAENKRQNTSTYFRKQFRNMFDKASRKDGVTGENLLQLLEARLDNVVYRLGIAPTRRSARQLVTHKHITVNGNLVNIPSFTLKEGYGRSKREVEVINRNLI